MDVRRAYCSAVDRNVPVVLRAGAEPRDRMSLADPADLICLDYKVRCTGWCCPLFSVSDDPERDAVAAGGVAAGPTMHAAAGGEAARRSGRAPDGRADSPASQRRWTRPT